MLQFTCGVGFGVNIGDFLEFERPFHGYRVLDTAAEKQRVVLLDEAVRQLLERRIDPERLPYQLRQFAQALDQGGLALGLQSAQTAENQRQHQKGRKLRGEGLRGSNADLGTGPREKGHVAFPHEGAVVDIGDHEARKEFAGLGETQGGERVGGLTALGNGDEKRIGMGHAPAIAELRGNFDLAGNPGDILEPVPRDEPGMIARAAGHDLDRPRLCENRFGALAEHRCIDVAGREPRERRRECRRLLVDLLQHVVFEVAEIGVFDGARDTLHLALHRLAGRVIDRQPDGRADHEIAFLEIDEAVRHLSQGQRVGSEKVLADAHADHQGASGAGGDDLVRMLRVDGRQRVGTLEPTHRIAHRGEQVIPLVEGVVQEVNDDLRVRRRYELIAAGGEFLAQSRVILDDAVVDNRNALTGNVRVGIGCRRHAVRRPPRVRDADAAEDRVERLRLLEGGDLALTLVKLERLLVVDKCHSGGVVTPIFKAPETLKEDLRNFATRRCGDDSAHMLSPLIPAAGGEHQPSRSVARCFGVCQPSMLRCLPRATPRALSGTSRVTVDPAATKPPSPMDSGATRVLFDPTNTSSPKVVRCLFTPS